MATALSAETVGPVDVALILFEGNQFNGDVAPAILELQESGIVHVIDLAFVSKDEDGTVAFVEVADAAAATAFEALATDQADLLSDQDLGELGSGLDPGSSALVIVYENSWSARLAQAIRESHGRLLLQERIPRELVLAAIDDLTSDEEEL
jgi:uncharacterized membrane protein